MNTDGNSNLNISIFQISSTQRTAVAQ